MAKTFRLLFIGDVIGSVSCSAVQALVPELRRELHLDAVIVNGENSAPNGLGITGDSMRKLLSVADFVTLGDHAFDQEESGALLEQEQRMIRPLNFADNLPGRGWGLFEVNGVRVGVINLLGRLFMRPATTSAFEAASRAIGELKHAGAHLIIIDIQAEATSEKQALGWYLAGKATAVLGTHTHTPTADERILPGGTAYISDVGMTGGLDSIIGFNKNFLQVFLGGKRSEHSRPAAGPTRLDAVLIEADPTSGQATRIERVRREQ